MRRLAVILAAGPALADASVVTLALPGILRDLDASVKGVLEQGMNQPAG